MDRSTDQAESPPWAHLQSFPSLRDGISAAFPFRPRAGGSGDSSHRSIKGQQEILVRRRSFSERRRSLSAHRHSRLADRHSASNLRAKGPDSRVAAGEGDSGGDDGSGSDFDLSFDSNDDQVVDADFDFDADLNRDSRGRPMRMRHAHQRNHWMSEPVHIRDSAALSHRIFQRKPFDVVEHDREPIATPGRWWRRRTTQRYPPRSSPAENYPAESHPAESHPAKLWPELSSRKDKILS